MAPRGTRICGICKRSFPREVIQVFSSKNYCPECAKKREKEIKERRALTDFIKERLNPEDGDWPLIMKQVKQYREENGFKYTGMKATLQYMLDYAEEDIDLNLDNGIALLPFYYKQANAFFTQVYKIKGIPLDEIEEGLKQKTDHITLKRSDLNKRTLEFIKKKQEQEQTTLLTLDDVEDDGLMVTDFSVRGRYDHLVKKWDEEELSKIDSQIQSEIDSKKDSSELNSSETEAEEESYFLDADDIEDDGYISTKDDFE